ncbi:MAG: hypothetical protein ACI4TX_01860, partial [Christensenellales bacterium]
FLGGVNTEVIRVDNKFKTAKPNLSTVGLFIASCIVSIIAIALFVVICAVRIDLNSLLWLIIAFITCCVTGIVFLNYSILQEKIKIDNFNFEETQTLNPLSSKTYNEIIEIKTSKENKQNKPQKSNDSKKVKQANKTTKSQDTKKEAKPATKNKTANKSKSTKSVKSTKTNKKISASGEK